MLALPIIKRHLYIGNIKKLKEITGISWCIPLYVKANKFWNLLVSSVNDVKAIIIFVKYEDDGKGYLEKSGSWINEIDGSLSNLEIGTERDIRVASENGVLIPVNHLMGETLQGNQDIVLELKSR
jgi:hypothetical protein